MEKITTAKQPVVGISQEISPQVAPTGFFEEEPADLCREEMAGAFPGYFENAKEQHYTHAVIEKGFAGDLYFKVLRNMGFFEDAEDGDGVGGGDESSEKKAMDKRDRRANQWKD